MTTVNDRSIRYYGYMASPYYRKVLWYLTLRGIPWSHVEQPAIMPRPDLAAIGVSYRRIPIMVIGKDVYCDTRIILHKLEELFPEGKLSPPTAEGRAIQKLLEVWHVEGPLFSKSTQCMPTNLFKDPVFQKDRAQLTGRSFDVEALASLRPEALSYVRAFWAFLEKMLADGRNWLVNTEQPSMVDIEGMFCMHWLKGLPGALPEALFSSSAFPNVNAWMQRFDETLKTAKSKAPEVKKLPGSQATEEIFAADFAEPGGGIIDAEPVPLRKGDQVEVFPTDYGYLNKDKGTLMTLTHDEIAIKLENGLRLHTPRAGFRVQALGSKL